MTPLPAHPLRCNMCNFRNIAHSEHCPYYQDAVKQKIKLDGFDWSELEIITEIIGCASHSSAKSEAMLDITGAECVEVSVRRDEKVLWVNTENGCVLRISQIKNICVDGSDAVLEKRLKELEDLNRLKGIDIESLGERNERLEEMIELLQRELKELHEQQKEEQEEREP